MPPNLQDIWWKHHSQPADQRASLQLQALYGGFACHCKEPQCVYLACSKGDWYFSISRIFSVDVYYFSSWNILAWLCKSVLTNLFYRPPLPNYQPSKLCAFIIAKLLLVMTWGLAEAGLSSNQLWVWSLLHEPIRTRPWWARRKKKGGPIILSNSTEAAATGWNKTVPTRRLCKALRRAQSSLPH